MIAKDNNAKKPLHRDNRLGRQSTRSMLADVREKVMILRTMNFPWTDIASILGITVEDARDLGKFRQRSMHGYRLTWRVLNILLNGKHAEIAGGTIGQRACRLDEIAAAYSRDELLSEPGAGPSTLTDVQLWLESRGLAFRDSDGA